MENHIGPYGNIYKRCFKIEDKQNTYNCIIKSIYVILSRRFEDDQIINST